MERELTVDERELELKYGRLKEILRDMRRVAIALSGGVDSALLLKAAVEVLGSSHVLAITVSSPVHPATERIEAGKLARALGVRHIVTESDELCDEGFTANPPDRCYFCKLGRFGDLKRIAQSEGFVHVLDGSNVDDLRDFRPGQRAAEEHGVRSPLQEASLTKAEIRTLSKTLNLPTWNRPSQACLASRFPYGEKITREGLEQVDQAEGFLREIGLDQVRVRHHGSLARIEAEPDRFPLLVARREEITVRLKGLGFTYVTMDLSGFRSGSMNEVL